MLAVFAVAVFAAGEFVVLAVPAFAFEAAAFALVVAVFASAAAAFVWVFEPIAFSVATAELAFASPPVVAGDSAGSVPDSNTERPPVNAC